MSIYIFLPKFVLALFFLFDLLLFVIVISFISFAIPEI